MNDHLRELYQETIIDHGRRPRNFYVLANPNFIKEGFNPLCGDRVTIFLNEKNGIIDEVAFQGSGCAISMASASLMTECLKGKTINEAKDLFALFHQMVTQSSLCDNQENLGKLAVLKGVSEYPARVKCATLAWHAMISALENNADPVSTE